MAISLKDREIRFTDRLKKHNIWEESVDYSAHLQFDPSNFRTPAEAGRRMMILYSLGNVAKNWAYREGFVNWMQHIKLWEDAFPEEQEFLLGKLPDSSRNDFTWKVEGAYLLGWSLDLVDKLPDPSKQIDNSYQSVFVKAVPQLGSMMDDFFNGLSFRNTSTIYDEFLFYKIALSQINNSKESSEPKIDQNCAEARFNTLNWLTGN